MGSVSDFGAGLAHLLAVKTGVVPDNPRRLAKYGILSGRMQRGKEKIARRIKSVVSIETDEPKQIS